MTFQIDTLSEQDEQLIQEVGKICASRDTLLTSVLGFSHIRRADLTWNAWAFSRRGEPCWGRGHMVNTTEAL